MDYIYHSLYHFWTNGNSMNEAKVVYQNKSGGGCLSPILAILTAMTGYTIHGSVFWTIMDFFFWPIAIIKWMICQEITLTIIKNTFPGFFQ